MIWYDLLEESQCQEQQFDRGKSLKSFTLMATIESVPQLSLGSF